MLAAYRDPTLFVEQASKQWEDGPSKVRKNEPPRVTIMLAELIAKFLKAQREVVVQRYQLGLRRERSQHVNGQRILWRNSRCCDHVWERRCLLGTLSRKAVSQSAWISARECTLLGSSSMLVAWKELKLGLQRDTAFSVNLPPSSERTMWAALLPPRCLDIKQEPASGCKAPSLVSIAHEWHGCC